MPEISAVTDALATDITNARTQHVFIPRDREYPQLTNRSAAYQVQDQVAKTLQRSAITAWKVGASGRDSTPYCAPILSEHIYQAANAGPVTIVGRQFHERGMEAELCFVLGEDLPPRIEPYNLNDLAAAISHVEVVMELVDSRLKDWRVRDPLLKLADNQMNGGLIIGERIEISHFSPLDFANLQAQLWIDDEKAAEGRHVLDDPIGSLPWLANHLAERQGGLKKGDRVITGSWTGMQFVGPDARVRAIFNGIGHAEVIFTAS